MLGAVSHAPALVLTLGALSLRLVAVGLITVVPTALDAPARE